jgi:predicted DNA-binding protein YlxM (UPF0122 family)
LPRAAPFREAELTDDDRAIYEEYYSDDRSLQEIAQKRGRTDAWVAKRLAPRALRLEKRAS